jgi:predicted O-methyltransferase YrrM
MNFDITNPIMTRIENLVSTIPGWSPVDQLYTLFLLIYSNSHISGDIIEIGSWCGRSSSVLAMSAKMTGVEQVVCVDLFPNKNDWKLNSDGSYSLSINIDGRDYKANIDQTIWEKPFKNDILPVYNDNDNLFETFSRNIRKSGCEELITTIRGDSFDIKKNVDPFFKCKFAFIDGDHDYKAVCNDIKNVEKYLVPGAWICFDDAFSSFEGVNKAIRELIIDNPRYSCGQQLTRKLFVSKRE